ncbi:MAG: DUF3109 family protein, partial [Prevotella sp.]|nr:DUF3109 family protein [Prevotella sp.]
MRSSDSIVIIPTYNEKENIEKIIRAIFSLEQSFHILVIDDGSPDGTADIVKRLMSSEFVYFHENGTALCAIEKAYLEGKCDFWKPISCHLYPIRLVEKDGFTHI